MLDGSANDISEYRFWSMMHLQYRHMTAEAMMSDAQAGQMIDLAALSCSLAWRRGLTISHGRIRELVGSIDFRAYR